MNRLFATACSTALRIISGMGVILIFAKALPVDLFAVLTLGLLCGHIISIFMDGGINNEIIRFAGVASDDDHQHRLNQSAAVRLMLIPVPLMLVLGYGAIFESYEHALLLVLTTVAALLGALGESYFMGFRATGRYKDELKKTILLTALILLIPLFSFTYPSSAGWFLLIARVLSLLNLIDASHVRLMGAFKQNFSLSAIRDYYCRIRFYSADSIFSNLSMQLDSILILLLLGKQTYSIYQPTSRLYLSALSVGGIVGGLAIPEAARMVPIIKARRYLMVVFSGVGLLMALPLFFVLDLIVVRFFGQHFQLNPVVASLLAAITLVRFIGAGSGSFLTLRGCQARRAQINVICTLIAFSATVLWAKSIEAVLFLMLLSQILMVVLYVWLSYRSEKHA